MRYYSTQRPIGPGTYPKDGVQEIVNFDCRKYVSQIGREAWGYIDYDILLPDNVARNYDLVLADKGERTLANVEEYMDRHNFLPVDKNRIRKYLSEKQAVAAVITRAEIRYQHKNGDMGRISLEQLGIQNNYR